MSVVSNISDNDIAITNWMWKHLGMWIVLQEGLMSMTVTLQQYHGQIGAFYNRSSKYTIFRYSYKFNNILLCLLLRIFPCLTFYVVMFIEALKNCTGSILKVSIISLHLLTSHSFLTHCRYILTMLKWWYRTKSRTEARY